MDLESTLRCLEALAGQADLDQAWITAVKNRMYQAGAHYGVNAAGAILIMGLTAPIQPSFSESC